MVEAGFADFVVRDWQGLSVRAGTPREIVMHLNRALARALDQSDLVQAFAKLGADVVRGTPEEFGNLVDAEVQRWARVAKAANIRI